MSFDYTKIQSSSSSGFGSAGFEASVEDIVNNLVLQVNHRTLWEASIRPMAKEGITEYYEIGPGKVLKGLLRKIDKSLVVNNIDKPTDASV